MFPSAQKGPGDFMGEITTLAYNRTGTTIYKGQVVMADIAQSATECDSTDQGDDGYVLGNVIDQTDAKMLLGHPMYVCLSDSVADNEVGRFMVWGQCKVYMLDDDVSTTDIDIGEPITVLNSEGERAVQAPIQNASSNSRYLGIALQAAAANGGVDRGKADGTDCDATLKWCLWTGGMPTFGVDYHTS